MMKLFKSLLAAIVFALLMPIDPASAQVYPCPGGGPGPGHRVVGRTPNGPNSTIFLCSPDHSNQSQSEAPQDPPARPTRFVDAGFAIAWHNNASDVWAVWNTATGEDAKKLALKNCNAVMQNGCTIAAAGANSWGAIIKGGNGFMAAGWGERLDDAKVQGLKNCQKSNSVCVSFRNFVGANYEYADTGERLVKEIGTYSPLVTPDLFHKYAVMAFVSGPREGPLRETAWISTGHADIEDARRIALDACQKDSAKPCEVGAYTANGKIYFYRPNKGDLIVFSEHADEYAAKTAAKQCTQRKLKCAMVAAYDAKTSGLVKRDFLMDQTKPSGKAAKGK
jgi:Domain of unknown function (DUF4189)